MIEEHQTRFEELFGHSPRFAARAPGRVNLIGEHTDYNGGYVFPVAINREIFVLAAPTEGESHWISREEGEVRFSMRSIGPAVPSGWARYGAAMADALDIRLDLDLYVASEIPIGSGLSSSAAIEMAIGRVLLAAAGRTLSASDLALAGPTGHGLLGRPRRARNVPRHAHP
ncbi:MAG: hypothetical protein C4320_03825 [Armatimonadota bacterium]